MNKQATNSKLMDIGLSITYIQQQNVQRRCYSLKNPAIEQWKKVRLKDLKSSASWEAAHWGTNHYKPILISFGFINSHSSLLFSLLELCYFYHFTLLHSLFSMSFNLISFIILNLILVWNKGGNCISYWQVQISGDRTQGTATTCQTLWYGFCNRY